MTTGAVYYGVRQMARATDTFSARWDSRLLARLKRRSEESGINKSRLAERYVEEGLRMDQFPGIVFRDGPAGRRASIEGHLDVWELVMTLQTGGKEGEDPIPWLSDLLGITEWRVRVALGYYAAFPHEVDKFVGSTINGADEAEAAWLREQDALT